MPSGGPLLSGLEGVTSVTDGLFMPIEVNAEAGQPPRRGDAPAQLVFTGNSPPPVHDLQCNP